MRAMKFLLRITMILLILGLPGDCRSSPSRDTDFEYFNDESFDPDWINNYDPFENPPCPGWNPIDGCGRTPARTKPPTTTPSVHEHTTPEVAGFTTRPHSGGRYECTLQEIREAACLHGGKCFVVDLLDTRSPNCKCSELWTGKRCEIMENDIFVLSADKVEKASIAAGIVGLVIIVTVVIIYLVIKRRKLRKERAEANGSANGHAGKALMGSEKEAMDSEDAEKCTDV